MTNEQSEFGDEAAPAPAPAFGLSYMPAAFFGPAAAFARLRERPGRAWLGPMVVSALLFVAATWIMLPQILDAQYEGAVAVMERLNLPEEDMDEALAAMPSEIDSRVLIQTVFTNLIFVPIVLLIGGVYVRLGVKMFGGNLGFLTSLSTFSLAYPIWALGALVRSSIASAADSIEITLGPGILIPSIEYLSTLGIVLDTFDSFAVWQTVALAIGIRVVAKIPSGNAWGIAVSYWLIRAVFQMGSKFFMAWSQAG